MGSCYTKKRSPKLTKSIFSFIQREREFLIPENPNFFLVIFLSMTVMIDGETVIDQNEFLHRLK